MIFLFVTCLYKCGLGYTYKRKGERAILNITLMVTTHSSFWGKYWFQSLLNKFVRLLTEI
jgi:hypothetical protein